MDMVPPTISTYILEIYLSIIYVNALIYLSSYKEVRVLYFKVGAYFDWNVSMANYLPLHNSKTN